MPARNHHALQSSRNAAQNGSFLEFMMAVATPPFRPSEIQAEIAGAQR
jgi:hypothetical protein